jgi:hypothetical protein
MLVLEDVMNVIFLSPHFPPNFRHFVRGLREAGANVLGLGDEPFDNLHSELRSKFHEYYRVSDMENYDALLRGMAHLTFKHGKIDRLDSLNEHWLETEAALRTDFNVFGIQQDWIENIKRKSHMKQRFREAGVAVARGRVCLTPEATRAFIDMVGYPVVAKPDIGVGAAKTYKISDAFELDFYLRDKLPVEYIVEEFIKGDIVTFDGLTDKNGNILFVASHRYSRGVMETVNEDGDIFYYSERVIPENLMQAGLASLKAFDVRERFFHLEFFDLDGKIMALEANIRPPGGLTVDMFNYANDMDVYQQWANVVVKGEFTAKADRPYHTVYIGRKDHLHYALNHQQVLEQFAGMVCHHERIMSIFSRAIGNYGYILRHPELEPVIAAAETIIKKA